MFFEGSEKKIELIFNKKVPSLKTFSEQYWHDLAESAQSRILSRKISPTYSAYLLSESSLFVRDHHLVMITCGTTQLVSAVEKLMTSFSPNDIDTLFYERKNELFPQAQKTDFFKDVRVLSCWFDGQTMRFGREDEHHLYLFASAKKNQVNPEDQTMEILMHGIDPQVLESFSNSKNSRELREKSGVSKIVLGEIDDHIFEPMGYSLNSIYGEFYFTIHITPEIHGSYISFETNAFGGNRQLEWAKKVLETFRPMSFDLMFFNREPVGQPHLGDHILKRQYGCRVEGGYYVQYFSYYRPSPGEQKPTIFENLDYSESSG